MKRIIGIGNALTDILINLKTDQTLELFNLAKGSMSLVDQDAQHNISEETADLPHTLSLGGSASNTIRAIAKLGGEVGFIGKVGDDKTGIFFEKALVNQGIEPFIFRGSAKSGKCISLVSIDGERTMATYLGAALEMQHTEIQASTLQGYDCLYIEGYLVQDHTLIENVAKTAKEQGLKVAIDLASFNVVEDNLDFLRGLVTNYVDILFANEQEASSFTGEADPLKALDLIAEKIDLCIVKVGAKGAYIKTQGEITHVGIMEEATRIDTTGAGDFYAAGFLWGLTQGLSLRQCGTVGAITAGRVIEVVGTTFGDDVWDDIHKKVASVISATYLF